MKHGFIAALAVLAFLVAACGGGAAPAADTAAPATSAPTTAATIAPTEAPTNTPEPTVDLTATADAENAAAIVQWRAYVEPDLVLAGYSLNVGDLAWIQTQDLTVVANSTGIQYNDLDPTYTAANFVLGVDVVWDSETGVAGCGIIFRADGSILKGEQAQFFAIRLSGLPAWDIELYNFGQYQSTLTHGTSGVINQAAGSTNHYVISADGTTVRIYANGKRLGVADLKASMSQGLFGYFAAEESGQTTCTFSNTWIWALP